MANYKVTDTELASIANAIRIKGGTSAQLEFPEEFVSAIEDISSSSGIGATFFIGHEEPTSDIGSNGDIYLLMRNILQPLVALQSELNAIVTANSNWSGYDPWKAFYNANDWWIGGGGNPHWLQIEFSSQQKLQEIHFITHDRQRTHPISRIAYSNNGVDFTDAILLESTVDGYSGYASVDGDCVGKYFRLIFDGSYGQSYYPGIGHLEMLGESSIINSSYCKVNGIWQNLIGSDINDVDTGGGGGNVTPSLPCSDQSKILASAYPANYSDDNPTWGGLEVIKSNIGLIKNSDFIYLRNNSFAKIDLGEPNHSFVAYFVGLILSGDQWPVAIGTLYENSLNNSIALCSNSERICYTHFGNTIAQTSFSSIKTFVGALRIDGTNKLSSCFVNGEQIAQPSSFNNSGQYCSFGAFSNSTYFANLFIKYLAVVDGLENDSTIISNQQHLMNLYGIE